MQLEPNEIHVWSTELAITRELEAEKLLQLSVDERERAERFRFPIHKSRFIAARSTLRQILCLYSGILPEDLSFAYTKHNKPHLLTPANSPIQFNMSHSDNMAIYAITLNHKVGIDIEKVQATFNQAVAERFFSKQEYTYLIQQPENEQLATFYRIWSRKEAIIKAVGKGLSIPLSSFSVAVTAVSETISLEGETWSVTPLFIHPDYQSALASNQLIKKISFWRFNEHGHKLDTISHF